MDDSTVRCFFLRLLVRIMNIACYFKWVKNGLSGLFSDEKKRQMAQNTLDNNEEH